MSIPEIIRGAIEKRGCTQAWVVKRMNNINPALNMSATKFSAIVCGSRRMSGDELLAFFKAVEMNPDYLFAAEGEAS